MAEVVQFVDQIIASPNVRLNLTAAPWTVLYNGTEIAPPPMRRSVQSTLLQDGEQIPATAYGNRLIQLHLQLRTTSGSALATQLQLLNRELDRPMNILKWQPDPLVSPVFFRTYRSPDYAPTIADHALNLYDITVSIVAEPFALGLREDIAPVTIISDPANGTNGKFMDITGVKGDVETPLRISIPGATVGGKQSLFAMRRGGTPSAMPFYVQGENLSMSTDTSAVSVLGGIASPNTGNTIARTTFATNSALVTRVTSTGFPASASVDNRGTYRVMARVDSTTGSCVYQYQLTHGVRAAVNSVVTLPNTFSNPAIVDMGLVQMPEGFDPGADGLSGSPLSVAPIPFSIAVARTAGSGSADIDYVMFVPADDKFAIVHWGASTPSSVVFDGTTRSVYGLNGSGQIDDIQPAYYVGDVMMLAPNVTNRIIYILDVTQDTTVADTWASTATLTCSYWPRYLGVRPIAT